MFIDTGSDCCAHDESRSRGEGIAQRRGAAPYPTTRRAKGASRKVRPLVDVFAP